MNPQQNYWPVADQRFPWLTRDQIWRIEQVTANYTGMDKLKAQQELYQQVINQIKNQQVTEERFWAKNDLYCRSLDKDSKEKTTDQCSVRLEDLADIVKDKYNLNANTDTNTVIDWVVRMAQDKNVDTELLNKYLDSWDKEFLYQMGFEEKPTDYLGMASAYFNPVWYLANKAWEYFFEHPAEISVWAAQSPWKWWYNLIWQWIDKTWKALANKLEWTELTDAIRQAAIDMFWEEEVKKFAQQKQQEQANWTAFNGRTQTDIRTPILWDKANSTATQIWEWIWDIATAVALSYPMAAATAPYMWINTASQAWRTLLMWAWQWAADMAAYEYWANQEIASPTELWVWAVIWAWTPFVVPMLSSTWKAVSNKYNDIMWAFRTASKEKLWEELRNLFSRWIKPSSAWIKTTSAQEKIYDDAMDAVETIINNKNNLKFTNANWEEIVWKLPTNTREFAQAIQQTKQNIYNQYNAIAQAAWKDTRVSVDWLIEELLKLKNDKAALLWNEWLETSIDNWLRWLSEVKDLSVEQAQKKMQEINQKLDAFYKNPNPNDVSKSSVDALVKNKLSEALDNSIEEALWMSSEYDALKKAYSALKTIEKDVNHRAIVSWRQSPNSLVDSIADISSVESLLDVLSWNPAWAVKALGKQALKKYIKWLNSSDNMVQKLFSKAEWELERSWTLKTNQQILRQQEREYQKWLNQWSNKNYLPYKEWVDDAWKTVIPAWDRIAVTPEWNAVREGQINEVNGIKNEVNNIKNIDNTNKIVNEDWTPLEVYHWTPNKDFTEFDESYAGSNSQTDFKGIYFTDDPEFAKEMSYSKNPWNSSLTYKRWEEWRVIQWNINVQNPLNLNNLSESQIDELWNYTNEAWQRLWKEKFIKEVSEMNNRVNAQGIKFYLDMDKVENAGYDGLIADLWRKNWKNEYAIFNKDQYIKSEQQKINDELSKLKPEQHEDYKNFVKTKWKDYDENDITSWFWDKSEDFEAYTKYKQMESEYAKKWEKWTLDYQLKKIKDWTYQQAKKDYDNFLDEAAKETWWIAIKAPLKNVKSNWNLNGKWLVRVLEKAFKKVNGVDDITDIVRGTIWAKDRRHIEEIIKRAESKWYEVDKWKFTKPTSMWYSDASFIFTSPNWIKAEVQINYPEMMVAKEWKWAIEMWIINKADYDALLKKLWVEWWLWHKYYEDWRSILDKLESGLIKWENDIKKAEAKMAEIEEKSREYYKKFYK